REIRAARGRLRRPSEPGLRAHERRTAPQAHRRPLHPPLAGDGAGADAQAVFHGGGGRSQPVASPPMFVTKAAVVGAGTMGGEIAQVISSSGIPVVLKDIDQKFVDQGLTKAEEVSKIQTGSQVKKERITQDQADEQVAAIVARITGTTSYDQLGDVDFVVEAVPERMDIKQQVFADLD